MNWGIVSTPVIIPLHIGISMKMLGNTVGIVEKSGGHLVIDEDLPIDDMKTLSDHGGLLLWDNDGQWGLINATRLQNIYRAVHDYRRIEGVYARAVTVPIHTQRIYWSQTSKLTATAIESILKRGPGVSIPVRSPASLPLK
jgi:hypothetical protein